MKFKNCEQFDEVRKAYWIVFDKQIFSNDSGLSFKPVKNKKYIKD